MTALLLRWQRDSLASLMPSLLLLLAVCIVWQLAIGQGIVPGSLLPRPTDVVHYIAVNTSTLLVAAFSTAAQAALSLLIATLLGIVIGSAIFASVLVREALYPLMVILQILPKVAVAPLFVAWFGTDDTARVSFAAFLSFFPILLATIAGLEQTDANAIRLCRSLRASAFQMFWAVRVPYALAQLFSGLKIAATLAVTGIVIGEFMTADRGLGFVIIGAAARVDSQSLFAAIVMLCVIGLALFGLVLGAQRLSRRWLYGR